MKVKQPAGRKSLKLRARRPLPASMWGDRLKDRAWTIPNGTVDKEQHALYTYLAVFWKRLWFPLFFFFLKSDFVNWKYWGEWKANHLQATSGKCVAIKPRLMTFTRRFCVSVWVFVAIISLKVTDIFIPHTDMDAMSLVDMVKIHMIKIAFWGGCMMTQILCIGNIAPPLNLGLIKVPLCMCVATLQPSWHWPREVILG